MSGDCLGSNFTGGMPYQQRQAVAAIQPCLINFAQIMAQTNQQTNSWSSFMMPVSVPIPISME